MSKQEKKQGWERNDKILGVIAIVLVGGYFLFIGIQYSEFSIDFDKIPISMTESSISKQCEDTLQKMTIFKNFIGIGEELSPDNVEGMTHADFQYYMELNTKIQELGCDS